MSPRHSPSTLHLCRRQSKHSTPAMPYNFGYVSPQKHQCIMLTPFQSAQKMARFPPEPSALAAVRMTRTAYAQLVGQKFHPPKIFGRWSEKEGSKEWRWRDVGMKIVSVHAVRVAVKVADNRMCRPAASRCCTRRARTARTRCRPTSTVPQHPYVLSICMRHDIPELTHK